MAIQGGPTYTLSQQPWAQPGRFCLRKGHWHHTAIHQKRVVGVLEGMSMFSFSSLFFLVLFFSPFSKDQRHSDGNLPGDEEQAAKHFTEHVLVLGQ